MVQAAQQLLGSCIFSSDPLQDAIKATVGAQRSATHFSIRCAKRPTLVKKNKSSQPIAAPSLPSAGSASSSSSLRKALLRDQGFKAISGIDISDTVERRQDELSADLAWPDVDQLLMQLRRSLLENHWALNSRDCDAAVAEFNDVDVVRSGRPSARTRRHSQAVNSATSSDICSGYCPAPVIDDAFAYRAIVDGVGYAKRTGLDVTHGRRANRGNSSTTKSGSGEASTNRASVHDASDSGTRHDDTPSKRQTRATIKKIENALATVSTLGLRGRRELLTKEEEVILSKKMKVGQNLKAAKAKLSEALGYEPSNEEWASSVNLTTAQLHSRLLEAERARDQMFVSNLRLVFSLANKYAAQGVSLPDLVQEGALGLLKGLEKFDYKKGFKLSTYVHWWIRHGITRALADHSRTVRLPAHLHERLNAINKAAANLRTNGVSVSLKRLSQAVNMSDEMVTGALKASKRMTSLDKAKRWGYFNPENDSMHNYVADPRMDNDPWVVVDKMFAREDLDGLLSKYLNKRERDIVKLHYGLGHAYSRGLSLEKISFRYGVSRERVRQIEGRALRKLAATGLRKDFENLLHK